MPPPRQDRTPERTDGITVELTEFGLWIEVHHDAEGGGWEGIFLSARALRRLVAVPPDQRIAALATLDPAVLAARRPHKRRPRPTTATTSREPPSNQENEAGSGARIALGQ
jgi:hypothetical protein